MPNVAKRTVSQGHHQRRESALLDTSATQVMRSRQCFVGRQYRDDEAGDGKQQDQEQGREQRRASGPVFVPAQNALVQGIKDNCKNDREGKGPEERLCDNNGEPQHNQQQHG